MTFGSAPAFNKQFMISKLPLSAAMCNGVTPPTLILTLAPAYTLENAKVRIAEKSSYEVDKSSYQTYSEELYKQKHRYQSTEITDIKHQTKTLLH